MAKASGKKSVPGYPVWVGDLHSDVTERELRKLFSGYGKIHSCKIKTDKRGRNMGYVNFVLEPNAEHAARKLAGLLLRGQPIRTKGPNQLTNEGYLKRQVNYRPMTDCSFFMNDPGGCSKGDKVNLHQAPCFTVWL